MKTTFALLTLLLSFNCLNAQPPKLYIHIVSHNEPTDTLENAIKYAKAKTNALQLASIVDSKSSGSKTVKWNLQTSDGFVLGALADQASTSSNIFKTLATAPYNDNIEIDPRSKNKGGRNVADQYHLLDSLGANPTHTLGGFIWAVCPPASASSIDWLKYRDTITGNIYKNKWKCALLSGAGSLTPHCNDLNDFGIFKPDTTNNFYQHNPNKNLWCMGVGCAPLLDSMDNEQEIIDLIQGQVDSIQTGKWPANKFYVTRIMTNQREYGPMFFQKIAKVIDSLNLIPNTQLQWATITETFTAFQAWQTTPSDYSQWLCGETISGVAEDQPEDLAVIYPNPFSNKIKVETKSNTTEVLELIDFTGRIILQKEIGPQIELNMTDYSNGLYLIRLKNRTQKIVKQ